jgi:hypothetical protein
MRCQLIGLGSLFFNLVAGRMPMMSETLSPPASAPVQEPKKDHYLPDFYLSAWCGADRKLERYVNRNGIIRTARFTTGQVG